ncbi:kinase-like domain-containing protein [Absidia repens]|uniref:Kinase-like domain-containing protein n=1 Tax=Absidia repens TaxID=90262 RepID=A0A1X2IYG2_9FUNG|nr:kinase-like domain-containing protein [Absidia repens]
MAFMTYLARRTKQFAADTKAMQQQRQRHPLPALLNHQHHLNKKRKSVTTGLEKQSDEALQACRKEKEKTILTQKCIALHLQHFFFLGRVKIGIHKQTGEKVAIKMIARSHLVSSITTAKSVQRELAVLQLLHHPHLVELKQVLQDSSYVYFVMEYLEGGELFQVLAEKGKFKESDARALFHQMVSGLAWCHAHHICHRDLKPENILLDKSKKRVKIADFGMSAMNTNLKTSCGSPHYASPEIVKGKSYDGTFTDVWSLGVILFALLSGYLPFDDENMGRLLTKIKNGRSRPLPSSLSTEAKHLVKKMLVVEAHKRISMNEILSHPWLSSYSSTITDPFKTWSLEAPLINHALDLEGRIWETLKVLWRDLRQEEIIYALSSNESNLQKLTCLLLQQRAKRVDQEDGKLLEISTVSCTRTIDMPPTPKNATFDKDLTMKYSPSLIKKPWDKCDHAFASGNDDPCINCPQQQGNSHSSAPSPTALSIRSRWIYQAQQLTLTPILNQSNHHHHHHHHTQQREITNASYQQRRLSTISPSLVSCSNNICLTSIHAEGDIRLQPTSCTEKMSALSKTNCLPTTYNLMEQLHRQQSFATTDHQQSSPSLTSMVQSWLPLTTAPTVMTTTSSSSSDVPFNVISHWWTKTLDYVLQPWIKKQPKLVTFDCHGKHECEVAGKIHQVLKEQLNGKLSGRMYPNQQIVWNGTLEVKNPSSSLNCHRGSKENSSSSMLWFLCQMIHQHGRHFKVNMIYLQGDVSLWNQGTENLISTLTQYEQDARKVMTANGW